MNATRKTSATSSADWCDTDPDSISAEDAQRLIQTWVAPVSQIETVAVRAGLGRVVAADIKSTAQVPNHTNAAMDGYALRGADLPARGEKSVGVIGVAMAGEGFAGAVGAGECVRIMTGAVMPAGADSVVIQERVESRGDTIIVSAGEKPGANVRLAGEDIAMGAVVLKVGQRLGASHLGLAASLGVAEWPVFRRPRVAFFSNGDELRPLGSCLQTGQLYDSNRYTLYGMLAELGVEMVDLGIVPDDQSAVKTALQQAADCADLVISSAGASVGEADYIQQTLGETGEVGFSKVAIKPGRPLTFGRLRGSAGGDNASLFFGLPGNPVSVMVTFQIFVKPALQLLAGETPSQPLRLKVETVSPLKKRLGRAEYQRGILSTAPSGATVVHSTGEQGSGILSSMGDANCFIVLPTDSAGVDAGAQVEVQPFARI